MSEDNKRKSPFNVYWIYAIIGIALITFQIVMSGGGSSTINSEETFFQIAEKGGVSKVYIVNRSRADFKLNEKGISFVKNTNSDELSKIADLYSRKNQFASSAPTLELELIDAGTFINKIDKLNDQLVEENFQRQKLLPNH